jgi:hypothetical protein
LPAESEGIHRRAIQYTACGDNSKSRSLTARHGSVRRLTRVS